MTSQHITNKHVIRRLTIKELSAVDRPANEHCKMTIMKRAQPEEQTKMDAITKADAIAKAEATFTSILAKHGPNSPELKLPYETWLALKAAGSRADRVSAVSAVNNVSVIELAKAAGMSPDKWVQETAEGREFYNDGALAKSMAEAGLWFSIAPGRMERL